MHWGVCKEATGKRKPKAACKKPKAEAAKPKRDVAGPARPATSAARPRASPKAKAKLLRKGSQPFTPEGMAKKEDGKMARMAANQAKADENVAMIREKGLILKDLQPPIGFTSKPLAALVCACIG